MIMKKNNSQNGFTLVEVLIALLVLTIGILGAAAMQVSAINWNSNAFRLTEAATWAGDRNETLMTLPYTITTTDPLLSDDPVNGRQGIAGLDDTDVPGNLADGGPVVQDKYTIFWNVADNYPIENCKTIRMIVRRDDNGIVKTVVQNFTKMRSI